MLHNHQGCSRGDKNIELMDLNNNYGLLVSVAHNIVAQMIPKLCRSDRFE